MSIVLAMLQNAKAMNGNLKSLNLNIPVLCLYGEEKKSGLTSGLSTLGRLRQFASRRRRLWTIPSFIGNNKSVRCFADSFSFRLHAEFKGREMIRGSARRCEAAYRRFLLLPLNPADRCDSIYVSGSAVKWVDR